MPRLALKDDPSTSWTLEKPITSIGQNADNDVRLEDNGVADNHAILVFDGTSFALQSLKRSYDVLVNGKKRKKHTLRHMDLVEMGGTQLIFRLLEGPSGGASAHELEGLRMELEGFRKLQHFSQRLIEQYELDGLLEQMMDAVIDITRADKGFLILVEGDSWHVRVARNIERGDIQEGSGQISDSIVSKVAHSRSSLIVSDALHDEEFSGAQSVINLKLNSVMCAPLLDKGRLLGVLYVGNEHVTNLFGRRHLDLLTIFASQASLILANAILVNELRLDNQTLAQRIEEMRYGSIIGSSAGMRRIFDTIEKVAPTSVSVLVLGETGTGKELIANEIHRRSPRAQGPFVTINCGAIPENLLESELFGHVRGAFTGAAATRQGRFQAADGGTIFLDEIGEMPLNLQVKLLRVLQDRTITKVGATQSEAIDIRILAATHVDLEAAVQQGRFREDLYYRLNVVQLRLPPLRDREEDVVLIAKYLIQSIADDLGMAPKELGAEATAALKKYAWPGNIRQLENRLKKALLLANSSILTPEDLDLMPEVLDDRPVGLAEAKERFARRYILEALERHGDNRTQTAKELGVDPRTIFRYLEKEEDDAT